MHCDSTSIHTAAKWRSSSPNSFFKRRKLPTIAAHGPHHSWYTSTTETWTTASQDVWHNIITESPYVCAVFNCGCVLQSISNWRKLATGFAKWLQHSSFKPSPHKTRKIKDFSWPTNDVVWQFQWVTFMLCLTPQTLLGNHLLPLLSRLNLLLELHFLLPSRHLGCLLLLIFLCTLKKNIWTL